MANNKPYDIAIITPTLNAAKYLPGCLESVRRQRDVRVQHIIVDGGSNDATIEIVKHSTAELQLAPGSSIYEAHNEGIKHAHAPVLGAINADDRYASEYALATILETRRKVKKTGVIYGNCTFVDTEGQELYRLIPPYKLTLKGASRRVMNISHPSWFIDADSMTRLGCYDTSLRFVADCDLIIRAIEEGVDFTYVDFDVAKFTLHVNNASRTGPARDEHIHYFRGLNGPSPLRRILHSLALIHLYSRDPRYFIYWVKRRLCKTGVKRA